MAVYNRFLYSFFFIFMLCSVSLRAQFFLNGEDPARIKWNQIKSKNYTVIYPREIDSLAVRYLWLLENDREKVLGGLNINPKPLPVILHPYTARSNGLVTWVPKRMELYTQPPASSYPQNWETQLVLHESRHVGQISHFTKGIYKVLQYPFGEQIVGLGLGLYTARWFLEGDAVVAETALSNSGRGREASFMEYYRAAILEEDYRTWYRWRYGSYKYYTPDMYSFGYLINSTIIYGTGDYEYPGQMLDYIVRKFYNPFADDVLNKKITGHETYGTLSAGIKLMDSIWRSDLPARGKFTPYRDLRHNRSNYHTSYRNPVAVSPDSVIYIKSSYDNPPSLVLLSSDPKFTSRYKKGEKKLRAFDPSAKGLQLSAKNKIYFTETINSPRWQNESYNRLFYYDITKGKIKKLSGRTSYNSPALSPEGDSVAVIEYKIKGGSGIALLDALTGDKYNFFPAPHNGQLTSCTWVNGNIFAFNITKKGMGLFKININRAGNMSSGGVQSKEQWDNIWERVIDEQNMSLQALKSSGDTLYFSSGIDGVTNIYMYDAAGGTFNRLTNSKYGAYDPSISGNRMFFSRTGRMGFSPAVTELNEKEQEGYKVTLQNGRLSSDYKFAVAEELSRLANRFIEEKGLRNIPDNNTRISMQKQFADSVKIKKYNKLSHLFRIHSWAPVYYNADKILNGDFDKIYEAVSPGVTIYSQNTLGTAVTMLGYSYYKGFHAGHLSFRYSGLYPVFELKADINSEDRYKIYNIKNTDGKNEWKTVYLNSALIETSLRIYVPLRFNSHGWSRGVTPQIQWDFNNNMFLSDRKEKYLYRNQINGIIQYYQMRPAATGGIFPKWGIGTVIKGGFSPVAGNNFAQAGSAYVYGYLPGAVPVHGLKLSAAYQRQFINGKAFYIDNLVDMPRGYKRNIYGKNYFKATIDYAMPMNFRGISLGWPAYLKRLQIIPYADFAVIDKKHFYTYGGDILLDANFFHITAPVSVGLRYGRNGNNNNYQVEKNIFRLLFNISFY